MAEITEITNILGDLDTYADELDGEGWHNAANGCRYARDEIERLRALNAEMLAALRDIVYALRGLGVDGWSDAPHLLSVCGNRRRQSGGRANMTTDAMRCDVCGRFVSIEDLASGRARRRLVTPDSHFSCEEYETLCRDHATAARAPAT